MKSLKCKFCGYINLVPHEPVGDEHTLCPQCGASYEADEDKTIKLDVADGGSPGDESAGGDEKKFHFHTDSK